MNWKILRRIFPLNDFKNLKRFALVFFKSLPILTLIIVMFFAHHEIMRVAIYFILGSFFAIIFAPFVSFSSKYLRLPKISSIIFVFLVFFLVVYFSLKMVTPYLIKELENFKTIISQNKFEEILDKYSLILKSYFPNFEVPQIGNILNTQIKNLISRTSGIVINFISFISNTVIIFIITFFLLKDGRKLKNIFIRLLPNNFFEVSFSVIYKIEVQLTNYVRAQFFRAFIIAILTTLALKAFNIPYFIILGIFYGINKYYPFHWTNYRSNSYYCGNSCHIWYLS